MARYCMSTVTSVKAVQKPDGQWAVEGLEGGRYARGFEPIIRLSYPYNVSFYMTTKARECLDRLSSNLSDVSNAYIPIESISSGYHVPEVFFSGKVQFITGYNVSEHPEAGEETATALGNVRLLETQVYLCSLLLTLMFIGFIIARVLMYAKPLSPRWKVRLIRREINDMFYYSNNHFKLITTLFCVLCFYIITSFLCLYKTSHVIIEKPFYPKSYQESLDHRPSLAFFFDQFAMVSNGFRDAPKNSLKNKLWMKALNSGRKDEYDTGTLSAASMFQRLTRASEELTVRKGIAVASVLSMPFIRSIACSASPDGQLWVMKVAADPVEQEIIYGPPMRTGSFYAKHYAHRFKRTFENHVSARTYMISLDLSETVSRFMGLSSTHVWKQKVICDQPDAFAADPEVRAIPLAYFNSFLVVCSVVWAFAFLLNYLQIVLHRMKREERSKKLISSLQVGSERARTA